MREQAGRLAGICLTGAFQRCSGILLATFFTTFFTTFLTTSVSARMRTREQQTGLEQRRLICRSTKLLSYDAAYSSRPSWASSRPSSPWPCRHRQASSARTRNQCGRPRPPSAGRRAAGQIPGTCALKKAVSAGYPATCERVVSCSHADEGHGCEEAEKSHLR